MEMKSSLLPTKNSAFGVIILAAGEGKRMRSSLPKVLNILAGEPLLFHTLRAVKKVSLKAPVAVVVGYQKELVQDSIKGCFEFSEMNITFIDQPQRLGTGDAARMAMESSWGEKLVRSKTSVLVLPGDQPLMTAPLIEQMVEPLGRTSCMRLLTTVLPDPSGYGRVVRRGKNGSVSRIVEEKDANLREKAIHEVAVSIYFFQPSFLRSGLKKISNKNAQKEYYLPDLVAQAGGVNCRCEVLLWSHYPDVTGINNPWELSHAAKMLNLRILKNWALEGVIIMDPDSTWVDRSVVIAPGVILHPGVILKGDTQIGAHSAIGPYAQLIDSKIDESVTIKTGCVLEKSSVASYSAVGPYAHLRPESVLAEKCKVGNFVELKKTKLGKGTKVSHLSYLGDATVGAEVNVGCGFVTCNFDGKNKNHTTIEDDVFIGSDCQVIAPITIGKGSYVASGTTVTRSLEPDALAIARVKQENKLGYATRIRKK